jgi:hypothetical protein
MSRKMKVRGKELPYTRAWKERMNTYVEEPKHQTEEEKRVEKYIHEIDRLRANEQTLKTKIAELIYGINNVITSIELEGYRRALCCDLYNGLCKLLNRSSINVQDKCGVAKACNELKFQNEAMQITITRLLEELSRAIILPSKEEKETLRRVKVRGNDGLSNGSTVLTK